MLLLINNLVLTLDNIRGETIESENSDNENYREKKRKKKIKDYYDPTMLAEDDLFCDQSKKLLLLNEIIGLARGDNGFSSVRTSNKRKHDDSDIHMVDIKSKKVKNGCCSSSLQLLETPKKKQKPADLIVPPTPSHPGGLHI